MTALGDFSSGDVLTAADLNAIGTWQDYTPTWTATVSDPDVGAGSLNGRYCQINDLVIGQVYIQTGSGYDRGEGYYKISVPVTPSTSNDDNAICGQAWLYDSSGAIADYLMLRFTSGDVNLQGYVIDRSGAFGWAHNIPFTVGQNDQMRLMFSYKAA